MGVVYNYDMPDHHHNFNGEYVSFTDMISDKYQQGLLSFVKYMVYGREVCPQTGTPHLQMFFIVKSLMNIKGFQKKLSEAFGFESTVAVKIADSNIQECIKYCTKDGDVVHFGEKPKGKGCRTDLEAVAELIESNASLYEIAKQCPTQFIQYSTGISKLIQFTMKPRDFKTEVYWCYGTTGTGKSRWCMEQMDRENFYSKNSQNKWWDGYYGQVDVLIDDFRPNKELNFGYMLNLMDRYPMLIEAKGSTIHFVSHRIFITAPLTPRELFMEISDGKWSNDAIDQFERRITKVIHFTEMQSGIGYQNLISRGSPEMNQWSNIARPNVETLTVGIVSTDETCDEDMSVNICSKRLYSESQSSSSSSSVDLT
jgi:hypothetical protein